MNELYWIERLDAVNVTFVIILIVALVWLVYVFIESNVESYSEKECIDKGIYKAKKVSYVITIRFFIISCNFIQKNIKRFVTFFRQFI